MEKCAIRLNSKDSLVRQRSKWEPPPEFMDTGLLSLPIQEVFKQNNRIRNAMLVGRIKTLGQLVRQTEADLLLLPNLGRTSLKIINDALIGYKLHLEMTEDEINAGSQNADEAIAKFQLGDAASGIVVDEIPGLSNRTVNCLKSSDIRTVGLLKSKTETDLMLINGFGKACLQEIRSGLQILGEEIRTGKARSLLPPSISPADRPYVPLDFSVEVLFQDHRKIRRGLRTAGIKTLQQLLRLPAHEVLRIPGFSRESLLIIRAHLAQWSVQLGMSAADVSEILACNNLRSAPKGLRDQGQESGIEAPNPGQLGAISSSASPLGLRISEAFDDETRVKNALDIAGVTTIEDLVCRTTSELLSLPKFGLNSLKAIRTRLSSWGLHLGMTARELDEFRLRPKQSSSVFGEAPSGSNLLDAVRGLLATLSPRDHQLIRFHFQMVWKSTLEQTGRHFKLTRERVRQLLSQACRKLFARLLRAGMMEAAAQLRGVGGYVHVNSDRVPFLTVKELKIRPLARLLNGISDAGRHEDAIFFDQEYRVWHLGGETVRESLRGLQERLSALTSLDEVAASIQAALKLPPSEANLAQSMAATYCALELVQMPGTQYWWRRRAAKQEVVEGLLLRLFPEGAHFSEISKATSHLPGKWRLVARNVHTQLALNPNVVLWGRGSFRHKNAIKLNESLMAQFLEKIDEFFLPGVSTVSAHAVFDRYKSLAVQIGLVNPYALYGCLEWLHPKRYLYRHFPDIESPTATRLPRVRRVQEFEAILADSNGPMSVDEIIQRMGSHRRLKEHHIAQRLPESRCVLLYDAGCYVHESVLGLPGESKRDIQNRARKFLRRGPGYATTKEIRLALDLPTLKLPWTLRLLGSVLEQDEQLTRIYNVVALGNYDSWDNLLARIIRDGIGSRPGITLDELNEFLMGHDFITMPLAAKSVPNIDGVSISDGYIRASS